MKFRFILFFLATTTMLNAQVSGYMGKRFSIGYSNYFLPTGLGPGANAETSEPLSTIGLNTTHCLNLEYIIKSRTTFCFSLQTAKTGMDPGEITTYTYSYNPYSSSGQYYTYKYDEKPYKPMQIRAINLGLGFKFFQSGSLSPVGKYKKVELLFMFNHLTYKKNAFTYYDNYYGSSGSYRTATLGTGDYQFNTFAITYTIGRSRVLFDKLVLDCGIRFGVTPAGIWGYVNQNGDFLDTSSSSYVLGIEKNFRYHTNMRMFRCQLFNFHIGLGFLTF